MVRTTLAALPGLLFLAPVVAAPLPKPRPPDTFLVQTIGGLQFLGADGKEKERLEPWASGAAMSPDGRWLAAVELDKEQGQCIFVLRPRGRAGESIIVPHLFGELGRSGSEVVWAANSDRLLLGEERVPRKGPREYAHRIYSLATKSTTDVKLAYGCWVTGWSSDGKRFLATMSVDDGAPRVAWLAADGSGKPEYITAADEIAYRGRLSGDGTKVLCMVGPKKETRESERLTAIDLATGRRTVVDEPGSTHGYCWSPDGSQIAYTWQRPLKESNDIKQRETFLITCSADGKDRKTITRRKYELHPRDKDAASVVFFFTVVDWR